MKLPQFLAINTALGNRKTAFAGTHHAFGFPKYAHRDLAQVQYPFNRRFNLRTILTRLVPTACATMAHAMHVIRAAEPCC